jgi:glycine reductase
MWLRYPLGGVASLDADAYESVHSGFDTAAANEDPNRLVPLDAVRQLEAEGHIGKLHDVFYTTTGVDTPVAAAAKFGQEIAAEVHEAEVQAVILTGT